MRKNNLYFLIILFAIMIIPTGVFAAKPYDWQPGNSVSVCRSDCDYNSVDSLFDDISAGVYDVDYLSIEIMDAYEYKVQSHDLSMLDSIHFYSNNNNINISGGSNVNLKVGGLTFYGEENHPFTVKLTNLNISSTYGSDNNSSFDLDYGTLEIFTNAIIDNVRINSNDNGLLLNSYNQHSINRYVYNGSDYAIVLYGDGRRLNERAINITNSTMASCACSLVIYDYSEGGIDVSGYDQNGGLNKRELVNVFNKVSPSFIALTNYNIKVDNSDVSCVKYNAQNSNLASNPTIYFTSSNRWSKNINKCYAESNGCNVLQGINSKIIIDQEDNVSVTLNDKVKLQDYFPELKSVDPSEITWTVSNPKILKIVDGKAIPLKTGDCVVTATYNDMNYTLNFRVTNNTHSTLVNPSTGARLFLVIALVLFIGGIAVYVVMHEMPKNDN